MKLKDDSKKQFISPSAETLKINEQVKCYIPLRSSEDPPFVPLRMRVSNKSYSEPPHADANQPINVLLPPTDVWAMELAQGSTTNTTSAETVSVNPDLSSSDSSECIALDREPSYTTIDTSESEQHEPLTSEEYLGSNSDATQSLIEASSGSISTCSVIEWKTFNDENVLDNTDNHRRAATTNRMELANAFTFAIVWAILPFLLSHASLQPQNADEVFTYVSEIESEESIIFPGISEQLEWDYLYSSDSSDDLPFP